MVQVKVRVRSEEPFKLAGVHQASGDHPVGRSARLAENRRDTPDPTAIVDEFLGVEISHGLSLFAGRYAQPQLCQNSDR